MWNMDALISFEREDLNSQGEGVARCVARKLIVKEGYGEVSEDYSDLVWM
ncbi:MAG: hypothetical protein LBI98_02220 [Endomicrobium sp.]|jgi:hypothetical protein|nr:hypothetical protein [Endomicrobium sp.]